MTVNFRGKKQLLFIVQHECMSRIKLPNVNKELNKKQTGGKNGLKEEGNDGDKKIREAQSQQKKVANLNP
jgi:hypothetical protein